jgi:hypothetical protein
MIAANNEPTAITATDQGIQTDAATLAERILARRPLFKDATISDAEADQLASADEADLCQLAAKPGALAEKARVLLTTGVPRYTPSFGEWRVLKSVLAELAAQSA